MMGKSLLIFLPGLTGGGAERVQLHLMPFFLNAGYEVTLFLQKREGELLGLVPPQVTVISAQARRTLFCLLPLLRHLRKHKPDIVLSHLPHNNLLTLLAVRLTRPNTKCIVCFHNTLSMELAERSSWRVRMFMVLCRWLLPQAHAIVAVSNGVADDLAHTTSLPRSRISTIYNPIVTGDFAARMHARADHPWLHADPPFILAVGRLVAQKDFFTLISAFSTIAKRTDLRLMILGEGELRPALQNTIQTLGLNNRITMPGYLENVLPFMRKAKAVVLSSRYEGFGNVLVEALACGTPVISTDCPHGPREILEHGKYGALVTVADEKAMADAILSITQNAHDSHVLQSRGREFTDAKAAAMYLALFRE